MLGFILVAEFIYPIILKKNIFIVDLTVFLLAIITGQIVSSIIIVSYPLIIIPEIYIALIVIAQVIIFTIFSFKPPRISLFKDSVDDKYGIK